MKIAGFELSKQTVAGIIAFIFIISAFAISSHMRTERDKQERLAAAEAERLAAEEAKKNAPVYDYDEELQKSLVEKFGEPPEGFKWSVTGELVAVGTDTMTAEDIVYTYIRALSILDFSTAQRYSETSSVIKTYQGFYSEVTKNITDYYSNFLRKQYKTALTTLELKEVKDTSVFADGTETVTLTINSLDLQDKDFWRKDQDKLFEDMRVFDETESDSTKKEQYLYDYIYSCYEDGTIGKRESDIELVLTKDNGGGWLVSNDEELNAKLSYEWGVDAASYINSEFRDWYLEQRSQELQK